MASLGRECFEALRSLARAPGHLATCTALLAIGVASTMAVLVVGNGLIRRPLPVRDGERLVVPYGSRGNDERVSASAIDAGAWRQAASLEGLALAEPQAVTLDDSGEPERLRAARVEAGFFPLLGVQPIVGHLFREAEVRAGAHQVLLSFGLWQRRFGGDASVVGRALRIDGEESEVIGVLPRGFDLPVGAEVWRPLDIEALPAERRGSQIYEPVGRLAPGRSLEQARSELALIARRLEEERPDTHAGWGVGVITLRQQLLDDPRGSVERAVGLTFWGAAFLLLVACANVAQLQIVRAAQRRGELAVRWALGASRGSLARLVLCEALVVSVCAALFAVPLSLGLAGLLLWLAPVSASAFSGHLLEVHAGAPLLAAAAGTSLLAGLLTGAYPALSVARTDLAEPLSGGSRRTLDRGRRAWLDGAVLVQVAVTLTLLSVTWTLTESYRQRRGFHLGFRAEGLSYYELSLSPRDYSEHQRRAAFSEALTAALADVDGVEAVATTTNVPLASPTVNWIAGFACEGRDLAPGQDLLTADRLVGPGYLETLGVTVLAGRTLTDRDTADSEPVAVVNQTLAEECWPGQNALGRRVIRLRRAGPLPMRVVGVVADAQEQRVSFGTAHAAWYLPYRQHSSGRDLDLVVRGDLPPSRVRAAVRRLDPHQPVTGPRRLTEHLEEITGSDRLAGLVMGYFAGVGFTLAGIGILGSMRRFVGRQRRAIGTRMAFGAEPASVAGAVVGRGVALAVLGIVLGVAGAVSAERLTAAFVHGPVADTAVRLGFTAGALLLLAAAACAAPALEAARVDPAELLRSE